MFYFGRKPHPELGVAEGNYFKLESSAILKDGFSLLGGGYERCDAKDDVKKFSFNYHMLKFIVSGRATLSVYNKTFNVSKGMVIGLLPDANHSFSNIQDKEIAYIYILFQGKRAIRLFKGCGIEKGVIIKLENPDIAGSLFWRILRHGNNITKYTQEVCDTYLKSLLMELMAAPEIKEHKASLSALTFKECKDYIDQHFAEIKTTGEIAEHCCLSPQYMARLFIRQGNMSPHNYLMRVKLDTAAHFLMTSTLSVSQIARRVGFDDPFYFSTCFKRRLGISPSKYRSKYVEVIEEGSTNAGDRDRNRRSSNSRK